MQPKEFFDHKLLFIFLFLYEPRINRKMNSNQTYLDQSKGNRNLSHQIKTIKYILHYSQLLSIIT